jgi:hypothetical protein
MSVLILAGSCLAHSSTLNMEAENSSENYVNVYNTARHHVSKDSVIDAIYHLLPD